MFKYAAKIHLTFSEDRPLTVRTRHYSRQDEAISWTHSYLREIEQLGGYTSLDYELLEIGPSGLESVLERHTDCATTQETKNENAARAQNRASRN